MTEGPFRAGGPARREPGAEEPSDGAGAERNPEREAPGPERRPRPGPPSPPAGMASQATWILGVVVVLLLAYITINTLRTDQPGSRGVKPGSELPPFAAPEVSSSLEGDANVLVQASEGVPPACEVRGPEIVNSCALAEDKPVVLAFLASRSQRCVDEIDKVDRLARRFPGVNFAAVAIRGDRDDIRRIKREHGWTMPVAYDRDGAVSNAYAIAVCPTITFARQGGVVTHTALGEASEAELVRRVEELR